MIHCASRSHLFLNHLGNGTLTSKRKNSYMMFNLINNLRPKTSTNIYVFESISTGLNLHKKMPFSSPLLKYNSLFPLSPCLSFLYLPYKLLCAFVLSPFLVPYLYTFFLHLFLLFIFSISHGDMKSTMPFFSRP